MRKTVIACHLILISALVLADECIKSYLYFFRQDLMSECAGGVLHIHPTFNEYGTTMSMVFNLPYNETVFIIWNLVLLGLAGWIWKYSYDKLVAFKKKTIWLFPVDAWLAVGLGRIIERVFWEFTLDYIAVRNFGIWDTLDFYAISGGIGVVIMFLFLDKWKAKVIKNEENM